jgi:hypothetical protein
MWLFVFQGRPPLQAGFSFFLALEEKYFDKVSCVKKKIV